VGWARADARDAEQVAHAAEGADAVCCLVHSLVGPPVRAGSGGVGHLTEHRLRGLAGATLPASDH
jgi:uncharacterized protein YbjT (DUF2867 family)